MARKFTVEVTVPEGLVGGDVFTVEVEAPSVARGGNGIRGQLAGLSLDEMTFEQLKREKINASSVLYKSQKRGASEDTIAKNQARFDAVCAKLDEVRATMALAAAKAAADTDKIAADIADTDCEAVYDKDAAAEM